MRPLSLLFLVFALGLFVSCGDTETDSETEADTGGPATFSDVLSAAGLSAGNYAVGNSGAPLCSITYTYPGSPPVTENRFLAGYQTFEIRVDEENEVASIRGDHDELATRWSDRCLRWEAGVDEVTNHSSCEAESCTPFNEVRLCSGDDSATFFAQIPECGHNTFPIARQ